MANKKKWLSAVLAAAMIVTSLAPAVPSVAAGATEEAAVETASVYDMMVDSVTNPIGIDNETPRFSWKMDSNITGQKQTAYQIVVKEWDVINQEPGEVVWDSKKTESDVSVDIPYSGDDLKSSAKYAWSVTVWDKDGNEVESNDSTFEMGLLEEDAFDDVNWIRLTKDDDPDPDQEVVDTIDKSVYTIEANLKFQDAVGIVFAAKDKTHFYMWQLNNNMENGVEGSWLRPHVWNGNGGMYNPESVPNYKGYQLNDILGGDLKNDRDYNLKLVVDTENKTVATVLDNKEINKMDCKDADLSFGSIGFRMATNTKANFKEQAWVDDLKVTDKNGKLIFFQDFELAEDSQFSGGETKDGRLYVTHGDADGDTVFWDKESKVYYRFDTDFTVMEGKPGIVYGGNKEGSQFYYSQIKWSDSKGYYLGQHFKPQGGGAYEFDPSGLVSNVEKDQLLNKKHHFTVTSSASKQVNVYVDGKLARDHESLNDFLFDGKFGFNSDAGDKVLYDNTVVKMSGEPVFYEDFSTGENPFESGTVKEGALEVSGAATALVKTALGDIGQLPDVPKNEKVNYTVEADMTITGNAAGIVFSASNDSNMFMWQLNGEDHKDENGKGIFHLRPHIWVNGSPSVSEIDISEFFDFEKDILNKRLHVKLDVTNESVTTYINDTKVNEFLLEGKPGKILDGRIGLRSGAKGESFVVDNLKSTSALENGTTVETFHFDFEDGANPFIGATGAPRNGKVVNGEFVVQESAGVFLTKDPDDGMPMFRKTFETAKEKEVVSAKVYASALGTYDLYVNGERVGYRDQSGEIQYDEMKPGWTDYNKRVLYYTHDITDLVKQEGTNVMLATVGTGWWTGRVSYNTYGTKDMAFMAKTIITYADGTQEVLVTDKSWKAGKEGTVREADIWDGETYDARFPSAAEISQDTYVQDESWRTVTYSKDFNGTISAQVGQTIQVRKEMERSSEKTVVYKGIDDNQSEYGKIHILKETDKPDEEITLEAGQTAIFDLGQNMVGWPNIEVSAAEAGTEITMHFAEMLNDSGLESRGNDGPEGSLYMANYRSALSTGTYITKGTEKETYKPAFSFYGFRYVSVIATKDITIHKFRAEVLGSATPETGSLETSDESVNQLISNVLWGQRGNYLSVPTDCPQRDERLGWSGDTQAFVGAAVYNANVAGFFHKWGQDARDSQVSGMYTDVIPRSNAVGQGNVGWGDAGILVPYTMYKTYADTQIIEQMYFSMTEYMNWLKGRGYAGPNGGYGDWLTPRDEDNNDNVRAVLASAYYALDTEMMAEMADAIGKTEDAKAYRQRNAEIKENFRSRFFKEDGDLKNEYSTQTCYLWALKTDMAASEEQKQLLSDQLVAKIKNNGNRLATGFLGTFVLNPVLSDIGRSDMAYTLLLQRDFPSWLYSVDQGATTIWERWNSYTLESGFGPVGMNSFNHYSYGAVVEWMYSDMLGIEADANNPGFKHIILQPQPDTRDELEIPANQKRMTSVKGSYDSAYGKIEAEWDWSAEEFNYTATVPANTTATATIPVGRGFEVTVNGKAVQDLTLENDGIKYVETKDNKAVFETVAGTFVFKAAKAELDKTELNALIKEAKDLKASDLYKLASQSIKEALDTALASAEMVAEDDYAVTADLAGAVSGLKNAIKLVEAETMDKAQLDKAITNAEQIKDSEVYGQSSQESRNAFDAALNHALDVLADKDAEKIDIANAMNTLEEAVKALDAQVGIPQNITVSNQTGSTAEISWQESTQGIQAVSYAVVVNGTEMITKANSVMLMNLEAEKEYTAQVFGIDRRGVYSKPVNVVFSTTNQKADVEEKTVTDETSNVNISGTLPTEVQFNAPLVTEGEDLELVQNAFAGSGYEYQAYAMKLTAGSADLNLSGSEVKVEIPVPAEYHPEAVKLYHIGKDRTLSEVTGNYHAENGTVIFTTAEMGIYAVAVPEIIRMDRIVVTARKNVLVWDEISDIKAVEAIGTDGKVMSMEGAIVSYKSNNTDSVEVDGNGVLTAKEAGSAVITVTVELNRRVRTGEAVITVKELPVYAPALKTKTSDSVTLQEVPGYEYALDVNGFREFTGNPVFTGLNPETTYKFVQRIAATSTHSAGCVSQALAVTTDKKAEGPKPTDPEKPAEAASVKLDKKSLTLGLKESVTLKVSVSPENAQNKKVTFKSSNSKVVKVSAAGKLTAKKTGSAKITVTTANGKTAYCKVKVRKAPKFIKLNTKKKTLRAGKTFSLKVKRSAGSSGKVTFTSNNKKVASVSSTGKIRALRKGRATITAKTYNGKKATIKITVKNR
jgi:uncharacterized protein YjdB